MSNLPNPLLFIQCDWNSVLRDVGAEAWISCKSRDSPGVHGKIRTVTSLPKEPSVAVSDGFKVEKVTSQSIIVKHHDSPYTTVFVAPHRTFSDIHKGSIVSLDVNDNHYAVSYSSKGHLIVWDIRTENIKVTLSGHILEVYKCRFYPSGKVVLSCGSDMTLRIWCAQTGQCPVVLKGHTMAVTDLGFINRGKNVISTSKDGSVKLWHCGDSRCIADLAKVNSSINCCQISVAPPYLDIGQPQEQHNDKEVDVDNKLVIFGCEDGTVQCVAIASRLVLFSFFLKSAVNSIALFGEEQFVVGCQDGQIFFYNFKNIENVKGYHESNSSVLALLSYKDIGIFVSRADGTVVFLPVNGNLKRISLTGPNFDPVYDIASDGKHIFTCCRDGVVRQYNFENICNNLL